MLLTLDTQVYLCSNKVNYEWSPAIQAAAGARREGGMLTKFVKTCHALDIRHVLTRYTALHYRSIYRTSRLYSASENREIFTTDIELIPV